VISRVRSGWAVLGDQQFLPGYCLILPDPVVSSLNDLTSEIRRLFLEEMAMIGDAILRVTDSIRINYSILGNTEPALHAHIFPRYQWESTERIKSPVWLYDRDVRDSRPFEPDRDTPLMKLIQEELTGAGVAAS